MAWLSKGRVLVSDVTQSCYRVATQRVAQGGFGEIYRGYQLDDHRDPCRDVAIKVSVEALSWHGEAYFGRLLGGNPHVVQLLDAFPIVDGSGPSRLVKYILILDWMAEGTVYDLLSSENGPWLEDRVVDQVAALLRVLAPLHRRGICHGDITPRNVFVDDHQLVLGDLGIAKQALLEGRVELDGATPDVFAPPDAYGFYWSPSEDVYQLGLLALSLLAGEVVTSYEVRGRVVKSLAASDHLKGWIRDATSKEIERFEDASEALAVLLTQPIRPARAPRALRDQRVVFTGSLPITRTAAQQLAKHAGALVQHRVNGATTLIVAGQPNPLQIGQRAGTKLFDAHRRIRRGQRIAIIDGKGFEALLRKSET